MEGWAELRCALEGSPRENLKRNRGFRLAPGGGKAVDPSWSASLEHLHRSRRRKEVPDVSDPGWTQHTIINWKTSRPSLEKKEEWRTQNRKELMRIRRVGRLPIFQGNRVVAWSIIVPVLIERHLDVDCGTLIQLKWGGMSGGPFI